MNSEEGLEALQLSLPSFFYTPEEAAANLRVTRRAMYQWLTSGKLKGFRVGQHWRISEDDLMEFMKRAPLERTPLTKVEGHKVELEQ